MQPLIRTRLERMFRRTPLLWILIALVLIVCAVVALDTRHYISSNAPEKKTAVLMQQMAPGTSLLPLAAVLLCVAYDGAGFAAGEARNCIPAGRSRTGAYLAPLLALLAGALALCAAFYAPYLALGARYGWLADMDGLARTILDGVVCTLGLLCAFHALCMLCSRPVPMLVAVTVLLVVLVTASAAIQGTLELPEMIELYEYGTEESAGTWVATIANPDYPAGAAREALECWARALPTSLMVWNDSQDPGFLMGASLDGALATLLGCAAFRRRNLE